MNRILINGFILTMSLLLSACFRFVPTPQPVNHEIITKKVKLEHFEAIDAAGDFDIKLTSNSDHQDIRITGEVQEIEAIQFQVNDNETLSILLPQQDLPIPPKHKPTIVVRSKLIKHINFKGVGNIQIHGLHEHLDSMKLENDGDIDVSSNRVFSVDRLLMGGKGIAHINNLHGDKLALKLVGQRALELRGEVNVQSIEMRNKSSLSFYWVDSPDLHVKTHDQTHIDLAGITERLAITATDESYINARFMRTHSAFVYTDKRARVDINVIGVQHTLARGDSNIYYFNQPFYNSDYMSQSGAVLSFIKLQPPLTSENYSPLFYLDPLPPKPEQELLRLEGQGAPPPPAYPPGIAPIRGHTPLKRVT